MSTSAPVVLFEHHLASRSIVLNRPKALNALNVPMVQQIIPKLLEFEKSPQCKLVLLKGEGRAFCAGGDVRGRLKPLLYIADCSIAVTEAAKSNPSSALSFFQAEYQLDHLLATFKKPIVAILNGITMGGGVGLSVHTPFRIATEKTVFAMPETAIGLFPDVGGGFFLPRLDGELGTYLGLTGDRLKGQDVYWSGVATHFVPSEQVANLEERLKNLDTSEIAYIDQAIEEFAGDVQLADYKLGRPDIRQIIDKCFAFNTIEEITAALENDGSEFAKKTLATLNRMSPTSLKVTLKQLRRGKSLSIADVFHMEFQLAFRFLQAYTAQPQRSRDFFEGVRAVLVDKDNAPTWSPASIRDVSETDAQWYFEKEKNGETLKLLKKDSYMSYPYRTGLPSEMEIEKAVSDVEKVHGSGSVSAEQVMKKVSPMIGGIKNGVDQKVRAVLNKMRASKPRI